MALKDGKFVKLWSQLTKIGPSLGSGINPVGAGSDVNQGNGCSSFRPWSMKLRGAIRSVSSQKKSLQF